VGCSVARWFRLGRLDRDFAQVEGSWLEAWFDGPVVEDLSLHFRYATIGGFDHCDGV
jgi:hypothetical protein